MNQKRNRRKLRRPVNGIEPLEVRTLLTPGTNLALFEFTNNTSTNKDLASTDQHSQTTSSDITSPLSLGFTGIGNPSNGLGLGGAFNETIEPTPTGGQPDYFEFTITPDAGYAMDVAAFSLQLYKFTPGAKDSFSVYFDEDPSAAGNNFSTKVLTGQITTEAQFETFSANLENIPELDNVSTALTFRVYVWGQVGTETMRLDNIRVQAVQETVSESALAYYGDADRLIHPLDELGNRIPDFSSAGYMYGNEPVPDVAGTIGPGRIVTVAPVVGDDMASIQAAIDQVEAFAPTASGFRGVVQLTAGEFEISHQVQILESGVILRGVDDGSDPASSTIIRATGTGQRSVIVVGPSAGFASPISNTIHNIVDKYVPVGTTSFEVDSTENWNEGDEVVVQRPSTAEWISAIGMDMIPPRTDGGTTNQWAPGGNFNQRYERIITRIEGNRIFLNAPITNAIEKQYTAGTVAKYTFPRINRSAVENLRGISDFASDTDEDHAWTFVELQAVEDAWVTNVTGQHFGYATVHATSRARKVTVDDAVSLDPKSIITGGRRYPFVIDGQLILMKNLYSEEGRHDFVNNSSWRNRGPNVFLNGTAVNSHSSTGPHQRWSTGTLYDTIVTDNQIEARNRGNFGSGHGWGGANMVFWNTTASSYIVQNPQTAQNWVIGGTGPILDETRFGPQPPPTVDAHDTPVDFGRPDNPTSSLYIAQRNQRLASSTLQKREYVLGDYDHAEFDGAGTADEVSVNSTWQTAVSALAAGQTVSSFDAGTGRQFVPASFSFGLAPGEGIAAAVLTLGLRSSGGDTTGDMLRLDDITDSRSFASLGLKDTLPTSSTTPITIELTDTDLLMLQDGLLNLVVDGNTIVDWAALDLTVGVTDIATHSFDVTTDQVLQGNADVSYTIRNAGEVPVGDFSVQFVWSPNNIQGDHDDVVLNKASVAILFIPAGQNFTQNVSVQLDQEQLYANAVSGDPAGQPAATVSGDVSHLFLVIDSEDDLSETNESNNAGQGDLIDSDDITYFPWDTNGNGTVTPLEAISAIQAVGSGSTDHDFDGNGIVTPLEALAVLQRIGYIRNKDVSNDFFASPAAQTVSPPETHSNVAIAPPPNQAASLFSDDDDTDLPTVISTDNTTDDAGDIDAEFLKPVDWLSVV